MARYICLAQVASDAGKWIFDIGMEGSRNAEHWGYDIKVDYIAKAIRTINKNNRCGLNYWVEYDLDQNGHCSIVVYFDIKLEDRRLQISFHTPLWKGDKLEPFVGSGRKTRWNKKTNGSREAVKFLIEKFGFSEVA